MKPNDVAVLIRLGGGQRKPGPLHGTTRIVLALLLVLSHPLWAATILVNETTCTLVDAITAANTDMATGGCPAGSGADTIWLTTDVSLIAADNFAYSDDNGLPVVRRETVFEGAGFTIERDAGAPGFRLLVVAENATLTLKDVHLQNGLSADDGGAVFNLGLTHLLNSDLSGNSAEDGGAIANGATLTLTGTTLFDNAAAIRGGAIKNSGSATLTNSTISGNSAGFFGGGGIHSSGPLELTHTEVSGNTAPNGGGILVGDFSEAHLTDSSVSGNFSEPSGYGSGIFVNLGGSVHLTDTTVSGNTGDSGGAMYVDHAGATLTNTTISNNTVHGIGTYYASLTLTNTTISGNSGAGISTYGSYVHVFNSTVTGNLAGIGGGIVDSVDISQSIVSNNGGFNCGDITDLGGNFSDGGCGPGFGLITGLDPVLADNNGPTLTHALLPGSSAIDAAGDCGLDTDQRGQLRNDGACDSGSYELTCLITVAREAGQTQIFFSPSGAFELVTGLLSELHADGDFSSATCLGTFPASPAVDGLPDPLSGDGRYYLARGGTICVAAGYGQSSLVPDPRDDLDAGPCP